MIGLELKFSILLHKSRFLWFAHLVQSSQFHKCFALLVFLEFCPNVDQSLLTLLENENLHLSL